MSENACAVPVVWGLALILDKKAGRPRLLLGASLLGIATLLRLQAGVFCLGGLIILLGRREWKNARDVLLVLLGWMFVYGALDALSWHNARGAYVGGWFHSFIVYLRFNLIQGSASQWGTAPWPYYLVHLWKSMPELTILLSLGAVLAWRRATGLLALFVAFFVLHSLVPHKELRFIIPALPLFCALAGIGISALPEYIAFRVATPIMIATLLVSVLYLRMLTFGDLGSYPERTKDSAWDDNGNVNRLLLKASRINDLCGLRIDVHLAWTGGSTYLHRNVPFYDWSSPPESGLYNYAILMSGSRAEVIARDNGLELVKFHNTGCIPNPGYSWILP
jgi:hypothetical protein